MKWTNHSAAGRRWRRHWLGGRNWGWRRPTAPTWCFSEEQFQGDKEIAQLLYGMTQRHREALLLHFREAVEAGEIRGDIPLGTLFRLVIGPLRLLIKQWGLSNGSFDLTQKRLELQESLRKLLSRQ